MHLQLEGFRKLFARPDGQERGPAADEAAVPSNGDEPSPPRDEEPLRAELYSVEQLEHHATALAGWHQLGKGRTPNRLLPRLGENYDTLVDTLHVITEAVEKNRRMAPAAEWLLDNFYLIEEQVRTARRHLPPRYSKELPSLANGPRAGYPRVYDIALELISHVDGRLDERSLAAFVSAYQGVTPLKLGELWAIPIMLRLSLIENLRRVGTRVAAGRRARDLAVTWAEKMLQTAETTPGDVIIVLADLARTRPTLSPAFVTEFIRQLQGHNPVLTVVVQWVEQRLMETGQTLEAAVEVENQAQASDQVSMGNSIGSLRMLSATDWREFVEQMSVVEQSLRGDPAGVYPDMDFATRDLYRHVVERVAKCSTLSEMQVAQKAIELAHADADHVPPPRRKHVGYYLLSKGRRLLERDCAMRTGVGPRVARLGRAMPLLFYIGAIVLLTLFIGGTAIWRAKIMGMYGWHIWLFAPLPIFCAIHLAIALVNWLTTFLITPQQLPRMNFTGGIPAGNRTIVVVPTMLTSNAAIDELLENLEIRYLANRDEHLHFALLTDFTDATSETTEADQALLAHAKAGMEGLREKYAEHRADIFYLFHRPRKWNACENVWMGFERKRGKLAEFNKILRDGSEAQARFSLIVGDQSVLNSVRYVITLDTDTQLPRDTARQLVGTMAHPLNRPVIDRKTGIVTAGYSILQPRVAVSLPTARRSWFVRLYGGDAGIDPYTRAVSDVYQDVFEEGSFIGKGIYDVDAFEEVLDRRFPENAILSHDLLEGAHVRSGLVSDVLLVEDHPSRYAADISRRHRWMRGDWQIMQWLLPKVPAAERNSNLNPLSPLSRWKILDNLRRSLTSPALLLLLLVAWFFVLRPNGFWTGFVAAILLLPSFLTVLVDLARKPRDLPYRMHLRNTAILLGRRMAQAALTLIFLPYEAYVSIDAIVRTIWRMRVSRSKLLEWQTAGEAERNVRANIAGTYHSMWIGPVIGVVMLVYLSLVWPPHLRVAGPLLVLWMLSPLLAWFISRPLPPMISPLRDEDRAFLGKLARRTWRYFDTYVTPTEHWLPPDNYQIEPTPVLATRTSPTNIGLALLSTCAAWDMGYIPTSQMLNRIESTLQTLETLERYRGHFYNWYDTRSLKPLPPLYVSTVDSGNMAGHLVILRNALHEVADMPLLPPRLFIGLVDTARVLSEVARAQHLPADERPAAAAPQAVVQQIDGIVRDLADPPRTLTGANMLLQRCGQSAQQISAALADNRDDEMRYWARMLQEQCRLAREELLEILPWISLPLAGAEDVRQAILQIDTAGTLRAVAELHQTLLPKLDANAAELRQRINDASSKAAQRITLAQRLAQICRELAEMDFTFLYDKSRQLFAIGYNVSDHRLDNSYYDQLASEARLTSYLAIASGQVNQEHWFSLGRLLTTADGEPALLSWSGSMFEYLMPLLVMPSYPDTLLDQTYRAVVHRQIEYGRRRGVPWGISESGYNATDVHLNYQYRAFGVPGLGFKRGLADDLVIAPYATMMAVMVDPRSAIANLRRLIAEGRQGACGMYEAIDYTPARVPRGEEGVTIKSFMVHHQGMGFLALVYALLDRPMQRRFDAEPMFRSTELLLQERIPKAVAPIFPHASEAIGNRPRSGVEEAIMRVFPEPATPTPEIHLLSNGNLNVMITNTGGGYMRWRDIDVIRWREDATRDCWGLFIYLRDVDTGEVWSAAFQPTLRASRTYEAVFTQAKAEFRRRDNDIAAHVEISVSPEDDIELRRLTLTNWSRQPRTIEITTYAEVVLAPAAADASHPAFSNLFVQTEPVPQLNAMLCTRRARQEGQNPPWMLHVMTIEGSLAADTSFESDRSRFIGRGRTLEDPIVLDPGNQPLDGLRRSSKSGNRLSNFAGAPLDPIVAIRCAVRLSPDGVATIDIVTGMSETRQGALALIERYNDRRFTDRVFGLAWTHAQVVHRHISATEADAQIYGRLAGSIVYASPLRRAKPSTLVKNRRGQNGLWGYGISGDLPIVLLRIGDMAKIDIARQTIQAHGYWRRKGLVCDLVIWNEDHSAYRQQMHEALVGLIAAANQNPLIDKPGGIFIRRADQMSEEDRTLMLTVARVMLSDGAGTLAEQVERRARTEAVIPKLNPIRSRKPDIPTGAEITRRDLLFFNGTGGFTQDGREYIITTTADNPTPAPWVNVIANENFGTVISESTGVYTWAENAHEFRLTPWTNDPVQDVSGEAFYIRDEESGRFWSPTPLPARGAMPYVTRHGFGYSIFEYTENGIDSDLTVFVARDAAVKFSILKIRNHSGRTRRLSATGYVEWVLGELRPKLAPYVVTEVDPQTGAIFASNTFNTEFPERVAFFDVNQSQRTVTGDRTEFIGRNGTTARPAALFRTRLSGRVGAGFDPCAAMQVPFELADGQEKLIIFTLGCGRNQGDAKTLLQRFDSSESVFRALQQVWDFWHRTLGAVYVETPDRSINALANGWLVYQVLSCRFWGRTGFYQSGGAFGFRDQLQDVMALLHAEPLIMREHLLRSANHQFVEGDVQHWWHPPQGRGVRTHFSDDYLWLPFAVSRYVIGTGDTGVLDERLNYLEGRPVNPDEESYYDLPQRSERSGTLYEHCVRAIDHATARFGEHGLPLMGCGDWNDGMNLVGIHGKGESVWLAFFLYEVLTQFADIARRRNDTAYSDKCTQQAGQLRLNILQHAWDGQWYRRAYFDDGTPLGSAANPECQIDSLPQSWSVLSNGGETQQAKLGMQAVDQRLVRRESRLIQLFDPPFDHSALNPGYIKGYLPGVRENGGQYTHAAVWTVMAFAALGDATRAWELFEMINPVTHADTPAKAAVYKVEPYVVAADVYAVPPHTGRGGWTWYTGSAGWMYRLIVESLLGLHLETDRLRFTPVWNPAWTEFKIHYRYRETFYHIILRRGEPQRVLVDGTEQGDRCVHLVDDRREHQVEVYV